LLDIIKPMQRGSAIAAHWSCVSGGVRMIIARCKCFEEMFWSLSSASLLFATTSCLVVAVNELFNARPHTAPSQRRIIE
jgi:hypothetical protein